MSTTSKDGAKSKKGKKSKKGDGWKSNLLTIGGALILAIFIRITLFEAFAIDGPSMEPTLLDGDRVVVAKYPFGLFLPFTHEAMFNWGGPDPGDVIILHSPADNEDIVKRVIGVGGDEILIRGGKIYRNGEVLETLEVGPCLRDEQKNIDSSCMIYEETVDGVAHRMSHSKHDFPLDRLPVRIPEGHVYVLGDHRDSSNDSRNPLIGAVENSRIKGKALFIYMSSKNARDALWNRIRWSRVGSNVN
ncbi:MAG: signal peptidase I [Myxococcota bacterium]